MDSDADPIHTDAIGQCLNKEVHMLFVGSIVFDKCLAGTYVPRSIARIQIDGSLYERARKVYCAAVVAIVAVNSSMPLEHQRQHHSHAKPSVHHPQPTYPR